MRQLEPGVSAGPSRTTHALVPCSSAAAPVVRELLARDLDAWSLDAGLADGLVLAALEAVANAVVNGVRAGQARMLVIAWSMTATGFRFSVSDRGARPMPASASVGGAVQRAGASPHPSTGLGAPVATPVPAVATPTCERRAAAMRAHPSAGGGRGRGVMEAVMDRVIVDAGQLGTRIVLEKALAP